MKNRRSVRLPGHDYSRPGFYFVTICTRDGHSWFGDIQASSVNLTDCGRIACDEWARLPMRFPTVSLDGYIVMPNHVHGILQLGGSQAADGPVLGSIVRAFKGASTRGIRASGVPTFAWQRGYYEHVIRGPRSLDRIRHYVSSNPARWAEDPENLDRWRDAAVIPKRRRSSDPL